jgi:hypothetical protein
VDDSACAGGRCIRCKAFGGDGCAANCTSETDVVFDFVPGEFPEFPSIAFGTSGAVTFATYVKLGLAVSGSMTLTVGSADPYTDEIPFVVRASSFSVPRLVGGVSHCFCMRPAPAATCGGELFDENDVEAQHCTPGFAGAACPPNKRCAPVYGFESTAAGTIGCSGLFPVDIDVVHDCNATRGDAPLDPIVTRTRSGVPGSATMVGSLALATIFEACTGTTAEYGPDQEFCTNDDPISHRGELRPAYLSTGTTTGYVFNAGDFPEEAAGPSAAQGSAFACTGGTIVDTSGVGFSGIQTTCDQVPFNDIAVRLQLFGQ